MKQSKRTVKQNLQEKTAKMKVWSKTNQFDKKQTKVTRAQAKTKEQVEELERKCFGKLTEHHGWLAGRNEGTFPKIQAQELDVGQIEENLGETGQSMQEQIQRACQVLPSIFLPDSNPEYGREGGVPRHAKFAHGVL